MVRLKVWQWIVLVLPVGAILSFLLAAAGVQIHTWGLSWIWAVFTVVFVGWRFLLVKWTRPVLQQVEAAIAEVTEELEATAVMAQSSVGNSTMQQAEAALQQVLDAAKNDPPVWENWGVFWSRCQQLVVDTAHAFHPEVERPLLNIYVPQAYTLIRGTVDDLDQWMDKLAPVLNQVTVGQAVQAYEVYQKLEPSARKVWQVWNWAQWVLNPAAAVARQATQKYSNQANQQLLMNLSQLLKEAALRNLSRQAIALYSGKIPSLEIPTSPAPVKAQTETLQEILEKAEPPEAVEQKPVNILLVGRTGAGKSSLINTLFLTEKAEVDVLPSTDSIRNYRWQTESGDVLTLWDSPGYEQVDRAEFREQVLERATEADLLLLVTPALDPALQMDVDFLKDAKAEVSDLPAIAMVTQVDKLRPIREWSPPYDWEWGDRPKEIAIREATQYRANLLDEWCEFVLPIVTTDAKTGRASWNVEELSLSLVESIDPVKQLRLARFLRNQQARTVAAAKIIDHYTFLMTTTQGLATLLKSPVLAFLSTLTTGSPTLAYLLAEKLPVEQAPMVIGKLQMAYELFNLLNEGESDRRNFDLLALWSVLLENPASPDRNAWAFGHAITEYWTQNLTADQLRDRFNFYLAQKL
ncbi:MAG: GTPase family protein [Oscillatoriales cyanobacterium C42_A2020_001]|nr:GTPase family protein [Leptolyngbyaceae cyanobacterium C42_A2020_001]